MLTFPGGGQSQQFHKVEEDYSYKNSGPGICGPGMQMTPCLPPQSHSYNHSAQSYSGHGGNGYSANSHYHGGHHGGSGYHGGNQHHMGANHYPSSMSHSHGMGMNMGHGSHMPMGGHGSNHHGSNRGQFWNFKGVEE